MPIYEYKCKKCGYEFEIYFLSFSKVKEDIKCPKCGGEVEKKISLSSFILKGSGWYKTDYKKEESNGTNKTES